VHYKIVELYFLTRVRSTMSHDCQGQGRPSTQNGL